MILTVADILKDAMGLCNAIEIDETPSSTEMAVALRAANVMIDSWSTRKLMLRSDSKVLFTLSAGKAKYTIGPSGCDITFAKPVRVESGYVTDNQLDYPLEVISTGLYDAQSDKNVSTSRPIYVAYDPVSTQQTSKVGELFFYYSPDKGYPCRLKVYTYLTEFTGYTEVVSFEPAYYEALIYNLAVRLFRRYSDDKTPIPPDIAAIAEDSLRNLRAMNSTQYIAGMDLPGKVSSFNIYTDTYK